MTDFNQQIQLKNKLKRTWNTFFLKFGRLRPVQLAAIPCVLEGKNALITATTAGGKTEAVIAPLCELILNNKHSGLSIIYISPTRALANDLFERLKDPINAIDMSIDTKTGDSPRINWKKIPDIIITTPESLDSLLCRKPGIFSTLTSIVIDEIHILDGTYRGDQLRYLLVRLYEMNKNISTYILSATLSNPKQVASRYASNCEIIQIGGKRDFIISYVQTLREINQFASDEKLNKILIFCNSRKKTEDLSSEVKKVWKPSEVVVHHGSLHKKHRLEVEKDIKQAKRIVCISTMTLELGIDIGDIDAVVLADPPFDTASFIQRVGRSGRRTGIIRVFAMYNLENREDYDYLVKTAQKNLLQEKHYQLDYSVLVQQIFSILFGCQSGISENELIRILGTICHNSQVIDSVIWHLIESELIKKNRDKIYASEYIMNLADRGTIHSNIPDSHSYVIVDSLRNRELGEIMLTSDNLTENKPFIIAGKTWIVEKQVKNKIFVRQIQADANSAQFKWTSQHGAYHRFLPDTIKKKD
jgi:ATP-dependent Lhr-like helicase